MVREATFADYAVALWDLPPESRGDPARIQTDTRECIVVWNRDNAYQLILCFDLEPETETQVSIARE